MFTEPACRDPKAHHYGPAAGMPSLRAAIPTTAPAMNAEASQVVVTNGAKQAVYQTCAVLLDPGDVDGWSDTMAVLLDDEVERQMLVHASASDPPPTWDESVDDLWSLMRISAMPI